MKIVYVSIIMLILGLGASSGQTPRKNAGCDLTLDKAPVIRGLMLGMTEADAGNLLGTNVKFEIDKFENRAEIRHAAFLASRIPGFDGIGFVTLDVFQSKIYHISVNYSDDVKWKSVEEFVDNFAPKLGIVGKVWERDSNGIGATAHCKEFEASLTIMAGSWLHLRDTVAIRRIEEARIKSEEEKKKAIKP